MKTLLCLLLCAGAVNAQVKPDTSGVNFRTLPKGTESGTTSSRWRLYVDLAYLAGIRQWGNDIYDFRPARRTFDSGSERVGEFHLLAGKVISVTTNGVLLRLDEQELSGKFVFLHNAPFKGSTVDDDFFAAFGRKVEPYVYTSAVGARRTVEGYDCGKRPEKHLLEAVEEKAKAEAKAEQDKQTAARIEAAQRAKSAQDKRTAEADAKVAEFHRKRAESGDAESQYQIALRYLSGKGVEPDEKEARRFFDLAAKQGHAKAAEKLKTLH